MSVLRCLRILAIGLLAFALAACGAESSSSPSSTAPVDRGADPSVPGVSGDLTIFAAASLTEVFGAIEEEISAANPDADLTFNFAGSSQLRTQLDQGAPADLFAAADQRNMEAAVADGVIVGEPQVFARNRLVVVLPSDNPAGIDTLEDLATPGIKLLLAQEQVPVGDYSRQALARMRQDPAFGSDFVERVLANVVSEEANVKQVLTKVQLGEADAGIVYASDVTSAVEGDVTTIEIPERFNVLAEYPIAVAAGSANQPAARAFIDYLLSPAGQVILERHGFIVASATASR